MFLVLSTLYFNVNYLMAGEIASFQKRFRAVIKFFKYPFLSFIFGIHISQSWIKNNAKIGDFLDFWNWNFITKKLYENYMLLSFHGLLVYECYKDNWWPNSEIIEAGIVFLYQPVFFIYFIHMIKTYN